MNSNDLRLQILRNAHSTGRNAYSTLLTSGVDSGNPGLGIKKAVRVKKHHEAQRKIHFHDEG